MDRDLPESIIGIDPSLILKLIMILQSPKVEEYELFKTELVNRVGEQAALDLHKFIISENNFTVH